MVFRRRPRRTWYVYLPTRTGWVQRSTATTDRSTAQAIERMLLELGPRGKRAWDLLDPVYQNRLALGVLFDAWRMNDLEGLRSRMADVDLTSHIPAWRAWLSDRAKPDTIQHYEAYLRTLMPEGKPFWRSQLTGPTVARWLATRTALVQKRRPKVVASQVLSTRAVSAATKRKYLAAVQSFTRYLLEIGELTTSPIRDVTAPPAAGPRCVFLELPDVLRLVEGTTLPYRAVFALAYGAGLEVSAILSLVEADIDPSTRQVRARGTKAWARDRLARVADWAWPFLQEHLATVLPGERVFRGLDRWQASDAHRERLRAIGLEGYRLHDARHHWAGGWPALGLLLS
jgi:integrase